MICGDTTLISVPSDVLYMVKRVVGFLRDLQTNQDSTYPCVLISDIWSEYPSADTVRDIDMLTALLVSLAVAREITPPTGSTFTSSLMEKVCIPLGDLPESINNVETITLELLDTLYREGSLVFNLYVVHTLGQLNIAPLASIEAPFTASRRLLARDAVDVTRLFMIFPSLKYCSDVQPYVKIEAHTIVTRSPIKLEIIYKSTILFTDDLPSDQPHMFVWVYLDTKWP